MTGEYLSRNMDPSRHGSISDDSPICHLMASSALGNKSVLLFGAVFVVANWLTYIYLASARSGIPEFSGASSDKAGWAVQFKKDLNTR